MSNNSKLLQNNLTVMSEDSRSLKGKYAIVTGGTKGIGAAIAFYLASQGVSGIAMTYSKDEDAAQATKKRIGSLGVKTAIIKADITAEECEKKVIGTAIGMLGTNRLDIIVNNAAIAPSLPLSEVNLINFHEVMTANTYTPMAIMREALQYLPDRGGRFINISSVVSKDVLGDEGRIVLAASKAALESVTRSMASVYGKQKLATFNSLLVGPTLTEGFEAAMNHVPEQVKETIMRMHTAEHRFGEGEDIAMIVGFLASEESRWINGASIPANGGIMIAASA